VPTPKRAANGRVRAGLHYFVIHSLQATPKSRRRDGRREGAYVCCWIDFPIQDGALHLARFFIRRAGFRPRTVQERKWMEPEECSPEGAKFFREAKECGASLVFERYPVGS